MNYNKGEKSENIAYNYILSLDSEAILKGGMNSNESDIYSPKYGWIEVKDLTHGARCGQFTESTIVKNSFSQKVLDNPCEENCKGFVKEHYINKNVKYVCVVIEEKVEMITLESFLECYSFSLQTYRKRSGTNPCPKKFFQTILKLNPSFYEENGRLYCSDLEFHQTYFFVNDDEFYIGKNNEIRKCSKTKNQTWLIEVKNVKVN